MKFDPRVHITMGAMLFLAPTAMLAQEDPKPSSPRSDEEVVTLESFVVTGSNIRRIEEERVLPVTLYDRDDMDLRAASTPVELFEYLPSAGELPISEEGTLGAAARGDVASISIRSLGSANTLTLVNGRRLPPHPISQAESGIPSLAVNINSLPGAAIQRIEVLRDGASAIYGADAAAGVANAILDRDADGTRLQVRGSFTESGGAGERRVTLSDGRVVNSGRSIVRMTLDYFHRDRLMARDRDFAADADIRRLMPAPWNGVPITVEYIDAGGNPVTATLRDNDSDNSTAPSAYGHFIRGQFQTVNDELTFVGSRPTSNRGITTSSTPGTILTSRGTTVPGETYLTPLADGSTGFRQTAPSRNVEGHEQAWYYNINDDRHILPQTDRWSFVTTLDHEINDNLSFFGDLIYYHADSKAYRDPQGIDAEVDENIFVPASNYWNPYGERFYHPTGAPNADGTPRVQGTPADMLIVGVRPREFKQRIADVTSDSIRFVGGLKGKLFADWEWESAALHGYARTRDVEHYNIRESRLREALARSDETAFNPFGHTFTLVPNPGGTGLTNAGPWIVQIDQPYTNPDSLVSSLYDDFMRTAETTITTFDAKANGALWEVAGRTLRAAVGGEVRYETYKDWRPEYAGMNPAGSSATNPYLREGDNDFIGLSPNIDLDSERTVFAGFAELLIPVFAPRHRIPLVRGLEFTAAARYERFSDFGDTLKPKYGMEWRIANWLGARASYNESFRAPNLVQTNTTPLQRAVGSISDAYRYPVSGAPIDGSRTRLVFRQGNSDLKPEEAQTFTYGIVLEVPGITGLSFTADYWRIKQTNVIANLTSTGQLQRDRDILDAYTAAAVAAGQDPNTINTGSGTDNYVGNPKVRRAPVTPADEAIFAAWNAANPGTPRAPVGQLISVVDDYLNLASRDLEGIDLALQYRTPRTSFGSFTIRAEAAYMNMFREQMDENSVVEYNLNENGRTRWKANGSIIWRYGKWRMGWFTQFVKGTVDTSAALGAATTDPLLVQAIIEHLGNPSYLRVFTDSTGAHRIGYLVEDWIVHNSHVEYRFGRQKNILSNLTVRVGVNNVFDTDPPVADESRGYRTGGSNPRGRQYYMQVSKTF